MTAQGFAPFTLDGHHGLPADRRLHAECDLADCLWSSNRLQVESDRIPASAPAPKTTPSAIVIKGKDLDALSDDPDELQNELNALAGPSAGPNGGQIYIDGFTGGQLPPKSSIREIRINQNPFSAQYDKLGLWAHRDSHQARHRQAPRHVMAQRQRLGIQFAQPVCDQRAAILLARFSSGNAERRTE